MYNYKTYQISHHSIRGRGFAPHTQAPLKCLPGNAIKVMDMGDSIVMGPKKLVSVFVTETKPIQYINNRGLMLLLKC